MGMSWWDWMRPGIMIKRWIILGIVGILCTSVGIALIFVNGSVKIGHSMICLVFGMIILYVSFIKGIYSFVRVISQNAFVSLNRNKFEKLVYEKRVLIRGPKIVAIGGGTGLSTMLRGLKKISSNITAVVTVADNGGGSGILRQEMGMLPPGDIRNCILALANTEPIMEKLLQYRFKEGSLSGQSFGNLFLAAMDGICGSFEEAVKYMGEVLAVTGKVLPVTCEDIHLCAELHNGEIICGESQIVQRSKEQNSFIERIYLAPASPTALPEVLQAIHEADAIILGPGSLYTSIIPNLLVKDMSTALQNAKGTKIYISNVMTQPGETDEFTLEAHIDQLEQYGGKGIIDYIIANTEPIPEELLQIYKEDGAIPVTYDIEILEEKGLHFVGASVLKIYLERQLVRHDPEKLAIEVMKIIAKERKPLFRR